MFKNKQTSYIPYIYSKFIKFIPGFSSGMGSTLDLSGSTYKHYTDKKGLQNTSVYMDWKAVGNDFNRVIESVNHYIINIK